MSRTCLLFETSLFPAAGKLTSWWIWIVSWLVDGLDDEKGGGGWSGNRACLLGSCPVIAPAATPLLPLSYPCTPSIYSCEPSNLLNKQTHMQPTSSACALEGSRSHWPCVSAVSCPPPSPNPSYWDLWGKTPIPYPPSIPFYAITCCTIAPPPFPELGTNAPLLRLSRACPSAKLLIVRNFAQLIQPRSSASSSRSGKLPNLVRIGRHQFFWALSTNFGTKIRQVNQTGEYNTTPFFFFGIWHRFQEH